MPSDSSPDLLVDDSPVSWRTSAMLATVACTALFGDCLLNSPSHFSEQQLHDTSPLAWVVWLLALGGHFPTTRGVELRQLIFFCAAALMAALAGARLVVSKVRPRMSEDDLWDFRSRAASPYFWWFLLLLISVLSSWYSNAPAVCKGQTILRLLQAAWWWPLAALLAPRHVRSVAALLVAALSTTAAVGLWYHLVRVMPQNVTARLQYPIGNELWLAACLLPGVFVAIGFIAARPRPLRMGAAALGLLALLAAIYLTRSRSAAAGLAAGFVVIGLVVVPGRWRKPAVLMICLAGVAGSYLVRSQLSAGFRAHSIRSRMAHEWPYAMHLFSQKPIAGHGDGAYAQLAGQYAREDQPDDPAIMRFDEWSWTGHAHNEFLELLSDLGFLGTAAFIAALGTTLFRAFRTAAASSSPTESPVHRWLTIGLAAALVASVVEMCGTPSVREPGAPPIFLAVWACLSALVRRSRPAPKQYEQDRPFSTFALRVTGLAIVVVAFALGWYGIQDWRAARSRYEANVALDRGEYDRASQASDFAAAHTLDPFQRNLARLIAVLARSLSFDRRLAESPAPPTDADLETAREALVRLNQLQHDAPRFLRLSRIESELTLNLSRAFDRRGDRTNRNEFLANFVAALEKSRADEPFLMERVVALWNAKPTASAMERLNWFRCLIRGGEMDEAFVQLFRRLDGVPGFPQALDDLYQIATRDQARPANQWEDRLTPETLRLAAMAKALAGRPLDAAVLADRAVALYEKAGPRLFSAHVVALHETVRYRFSAAPTAAIDENLDRLALAQTIFESPATRETPLRDALGDTRLHLLLAADREREAEAQIAVLALDEAFPMPVRLAKAYTTLASRFAEETTRFANVQRWCHRAAELAPDIPDPHAVLVRPPLGSRDDAAAQTAAEQILDREPNRAVAVEYLAGLRRRYPERAF